MKNYIAFILGIILVCLALFTPLGLVAFNFIVGAAAIIISGYNIYQDRLSK